MNIKPRLVVTKGLHQQGLCLYEFQCHYPVPRVSVSLSCTPSVSVIILYPECQCHYPVPPVSVSLSCTPSVSVIILYPECQCHYPVPRVSVSLSCTPSVSVIILHPDCQCHYPVPPSVSVIILHPEFPLEPLTCLFGVWDEETWDHYVGIFLRESLFMARKVLAMRWMGGSYPSLRAWIELLTMVISKETRAAIIALHKNGLTGKSIAATKIAPQSTIYRIIKNFKERASIVVKKAPGCPRKTSKRQDRIFKLFQLRDRTTSSAELAQEWQQAGGSASARTVRRRLFEQGLVSRRAAKKPLLSRKNIRDRLIFCKRYREWTAEDWGKVIFSDESPFRLFGTSGKQLIRRRDARFTYAVLKTEFDSAEVPASSSRQKCYNMNRVEKKTLILLFYKPMNTESTPSVPSPRS
ncbi:unnamed protein product [Ranitomeya imitator]|uniref:Transposase Tc1-like domain-containing protein n=1 Tax=Ranitomeya imitator TaxID=111125 RepID=A0ABN9M0C1_9NEOB|nr:unnamed protein product [Ranitomeya imitator]